MKGIVFTEFIEMIEKEYGVVTAQKVIDQCDLKSKGAYTSVGTYDHKEMFELIEKLSEIKGVKVPELLQSYGKYFFNVLEKGYPDFFIKNDLFSFLNSIDGYIHPEVLKLYPEAELPSFQTTTFENNKMELIYKSSRKMVYFAIGLIYGSAQHYSENVKVDIVDVIQGGKEVHLKIIRLD